MNIGEYKEIIKKSLSAKRYKHSCNVSEKAAELALKYGADADKARITGVLHDITKEFSRELQLQTIKKYSIILDNVEIRTDKLLHAITGAAYIKNELLINDEDIINAVRYHTTARAGMSILEKVIYLADFISADRDFEGVEELRVSIYQSLECGMKAALDFSVRELLGKEALIHIDTIKARNELLCDK